MVESLQSIYMSALLALTLPVFAIVAWVKGWWQVSALVHYTLLTLDIFAGIWWTNDWNLPGFQA
jgi:hypothetical protein